MIRKYLNLSYCVYQIIIHKLNPPIKLDTGTHLKRRSDAHLSLLFDYGREILLIFLQKLPLLCFADFISHLLFGAHR